MLIAEVNYGIGSVKLIITPTEAKVVSINGDTTILLSTVFGKDIPRAKQWLIDNLSQHIKCNLSNLDWIDMDKPFVPIEPIGKTPLQKASEQPFVSVDIKKEPEPKVQKVPFGFDKLHKDTFYEQMEKERLELEDAWRNRW
jgi:hypothetical protein